MTIRLGFYRRWDGHVIYVHSTTATSVLFHTATEPDCAEAREFFTSRAENGQQRYRYIERWILVEAEDADAVHPVVEQVDPHAELRAKIRAEAAEHRRYADDLWNREKKERSAYEHERAAVLEDLAHEWDLPAAIAKHEAEARKRYDLLVQLGIIKGLRP